MRRHLSRFISQSLTRFPKSVTRIETPLKSPNLIRRFSATAEDSDSAQSERVNEIVKELCGLSILELADLSDVLRVRMKIEDMPAMLPGMPPPPGMAAVKAKVGGGAAKEEEEKKEKTAFDLKLEGGFDSGLKLKIIKEVRACTDLGLKEAKELVEKAPTLLKKGVTKEEAEKIIGKMKEIGAKVIME